MKSFTFILVLFYGLFLHAQNDDPRVGTCELKFPVELEQCNFDGTPITSSKYLWEKGWEFYVLNILDDGQSYVIRIKKFSQKEYPTEQAVSIKENEELSKFNARKNKIDSEYQLEVKQWEENQIVVRNKTIYENDNGEPIYYKISKTKFDDVAFNYPTDGHFIFGASTSLIKIRPGNGKEGDDQIYSEIGNDFNIGASIGYLFKPNFGKGKFSYGALLNLGFSSIKVTPQTTNDFVDSESSQGALTISLGFVTQVEHFQLILLGGLDFMSGEIGTEWIYRDRPWIGLGFGYNVFTTKSKKDNGTQ